MSPEKQRIAIAEACGWTIISHTVDAGPYWRDPDGVYRGGGAHNPLPDYLNDLNAMAEAEKHLLRVKVEEYLRQLSLVADAWTECYPEVARLRVVTATAAQRAEALLRTLGKWEEGK